MTATVIVFAREPIPGKTKTRLAPQIGAKTAAVLADAFLRDTLAKAAALGDRLVIAEIDREIARDPDHYEARIAENEAAQKHAGHWGVPLMVFKSEPFFGQDRFDVLKWRMERNGLTHRH